MLKSIKKSLNQSIPSSTRQCRSGLVLHFPRSHLPLGVSTRIWKEVLKRSLSFLEENKQVKWRIILEKSGLESIFLTGQKRPKR